MEDIIKEFKITNVDNVYGLTDELKAIYIYNYYQETKRNIIVLTNSIFEATKYYDKLKTYLDDVLFFPMDDFLTSVVIATSPEFESKRLTALNKLKQDKPVVIVTNLTGFLKYLPNKNTINDATLSLSVGNKVKREVIEEKLFSLGYQKDSLVTSTGEYSVRGFVIDVYPLNYDKPIRIEMFGDEIEDVREFDPDTQLSLNRVEKIIISPYKEIITEQKSSLYDLLDNPLVINIESELINKASQNLEEQIFEYKTNNKLNLSHKFMFSKEEINIKNEINLNDFGIESSNSIFYMSEGVENFSSNFELLKEFVALKVQKYNIVFAIENKKIIKNLKDMVVNSENINAIQFLEKRFNEGFIFNKSIYITENDLNKKTSSNKYKNNLKIGTKIKSFSDINKGDYVVHRDHGIGVYGGVITLTKSGFKKDYVAINYQDNDKVYVPVEKITTIYKYSDKEGTKPRIHKLGSTTWEKTKRAVQKKIKDISQDLLNLYAERLKIKTEPLLTFPEEFEFASDFEFNETPDQIRCIDEINEDLSSDMPMDRLLCGDVGFGKTEVAFRAMFKVVLNGKQVAYLCPTTILSRQQYESALNRFKDYNLNISLLNRFTTLKETNEIFEGLKSGKIDIVIGTHKLLNKMVEFSDLGLLVIDEEQRFGVVQKERIKSLRKNVNVLTLSATPIPRTLKMTMSGLKDLSIIDTPPQNRYPIQTYVVEEDDLLIKDIIYKEISRKGQVFLLFNRVAQIDKMVNKIKRLVPDARICHAHGQLNKIELENTITDFIDYEYDVLVCSTIIETGIDISNVNSLIIIDAQNYGLSQLYQLRGRVGRSDKIAYAYLMYNKNKMLTETATKRLHAIKEFTELGSGYKIALRDLSIRGAGDLLGQEQAGFIDSVGYHLYTQMIKESLDELKGNAVKEEEASLSLLDVDTHISTDYVSDENIRIEIHKLINEISDYNSLNEIKSEIEDRFGHVDEKLEIYMYEEWFETLCQKLGINKLNQTKDMIEIFLPPDLSSKINGEKLFLQTYNINSDFKLKYQMKQIIISLNIKNQPKHYVYYLVDLLQEIILHVE